MRVFSFRRKFRRKKKSNYFKTHHARRRRAGDDLERLDDSGHDLVLQTRVLACRERMNLEKEQNRVERESVFLSFFFLPRPLDLDPENKKTRKTQTQHSSSSSSLPSVFSLIVTRFTSSYRVLYPGIEKHGLTLAYSCNSLRKVKFSERWPLPIGVAMGPLRPIPCFRTESRFSRVTIELVRGSTVVPMCCSSQVTGTPAASKTARTASAISGPMPEGFFFLKKGRRRSRTT